MLAMYIAIKLKWEFGTCVGRLCKIPFEELSSEMLMSGIHDFVKLVSILAEHCPMQQEACIAINQNTKVSLLHKIPSLCLHSYTVKVNQFW